jgi:hypothetical protein
MEALTRLFSVVEGKAYGYRKVESIAAILDFSASKTTLPWSNTLKEQTLVQKNYMVKN